MFDINIVISIGNNSAISASKITKITAVTKNREERGSRAKFLCRTHIQMEILFLGLR